MITRMKREVARERNFRLSYGEEGMPTFMWARAAWRTLKWEFFRRFQRYWEHYHGTANPDFDPTDYRTWTLRTRWFVIELVSFWDLVAWVSPRRGDRQYRLSVNGRIAKWFFDSLEDWYDEHTNGNPYDDDYMDPDYGYGPLSRYE